MGFGGKIVKYRHAVLIIALLLLIPSVMGYYATRINYDMLTYLPGNIETMKGQDLLRDDFGKGGFAIVVTENMDKDQVKHMANEYKKIDHVADVINLQDVLNPDIPREMYPKKVQDNMGKDDSAMICIFFDTQTSDEGSLNAVSKMRKVSTKECFISGMTAMVVDLKNLTNAEEGKYVMIAVILSLLAMMLLVDSYLAPILFLQSIGVAILYNMGTNYFMGEISFVTKAISAVLQLGVTMDYSIFLWHSYEEHLDKGKDHKEAMADAINATLASVVGSSATTMAGFLALCFMTYTMGKDLGICMAKGVLCGVICSVTVLPTIMLLFKKPLEKTRHRSLLPDAHKLARGLTAKYGLYIGILCVLLVPAVIGYNMDNTVYDFTQALGNSSRLDKSAVQFRTAQDKLKDDFGINTTMMIIADADLSNKDGSAMSRELEDVKGITSVLGLDAFTGTAIPKSALPNELTDALVAKGHQLIIVNSAYKPSEERCNKQIDEMNAIVHKYDKTATVIGEAPATKDLIQMTSTDFNRVNIISIAAVFVIILLVLRSISLPFILVLAIEFAVFLNLGISGFTGKELLFLIPVCVSTIQLGSTVDYAILTSTRYKTERMSGKGKRDAVTIASETSIPSILTSATGFFAGTFGVGMYSNIEIISDMCLLMARGAVISMLTVIFILPSLLMALDPLICRTTRGMREIYRKEREQKKLAAK